MTRRSLFTVGLFLLSLAVPARANDLATADREFDKQRYAEALKAYDAVLAAKKDGDDRWSALYRAVECEALLFRYAEAATRLGKEKTPDSAPWNARFLLLRAEIGREYLRQYGGNTPEDTAAGNEDVTRRTAAEWHREIGAQYRTLHEMRSKLAKLSIREERYFLDLEKRDLDPVASLWDFALAQWTDYLLTELPEVPGTKPKPEAWAGDSASDSVDLEAPPGALVGWLWEQAARENAEAPRALAREIWKVRRVSLPLDHPNLFAPAVDFAKLRLTTADLLKQLHGSLATERARAVAGARAGEFYEAGQRYADAVALYRSVEKLSVRALAITCRERRRQIELPRLDLLSDSSLPAARTPLRIRARNLDQVHVRLYPITADELRSLTPGDRNYDYSYLRSLHPLTAEAIVSKRKAIHQSKVSLRAKAPHEWAEASGALPSLPAGLYVAIGSSSTDFTKADTARSGILVNITELALFGSAGRSVANPKSVFQVTTVNAATGRAQKDVAIESLLRRNWSDTITLKGTSDATGLATFESNVGQSHQADALARAGKSHAYWNQAIYYSPAYQPEPVQIQIDTDRPIYRPGQKVHAKITVLLRNGKDFGVYRAGASVKVEVNDGNSQRFHQATVKLNAMGSASVEVTIPAGRLLGSYSFTASIEHGGKRFNGGESFRVEEYKRPEFEIALEPPTRPWKYGATAEVSGKVKYYFGGAVGQAKVAYKIHRQTYVPWFCRWWSWRRPDPRREIARGEAQTDSDGVFRFNFPAAPGDPDEKDPLPSRFVVEVDARDAGGRTISGTRTYTAGAQAVLMDLDLGAGFLRTTKKTEVKLRALDLNEAPSSARGKFTLVTLGEPKKAEKEKEANDDGSDDDDSYRAGPRAVSLEQIYKNAAEKEKVITGNFQAGLSGGALSLPALKAGVYRLKLEGRDQEGGTVRQEVVFVVAIDGKDAAASAGVAVSSLTNAEYPKYEVGETAQVLLGSSDLKGDAFVETWKDGKLLTREKRDGGVRWFRTPITAEHQGGITVRWYGIFANETRGGETIIDVPWTSKLLKVDVAGNRTLEPRQKANWTLDVRDASGKPVAGEALVRVYDRSLEYYAGAAGNWAAGLYGAESAPQPGVTSTFAFRAMPLSQVPTPSESVEEQDLFSPPGFRMNRSRYGNYSSHGFLAQGGGGGGYRRNRGRYAAPSKSLDRARGGEMEGATMMMADEAPLEKSSSKNRKKSDDAVTGSEEAPRQNFAETAFFGPQVAIRGGRGTVAFAMPDSLTSYAVTALALTSDVKWGVYRGEAVARKELMARLQSPRFLREGDEVEIKILVDNQSARAQSGTVTLHLEKEGKDVGAVFGQKEKTAKFKSAAGKQAQATWRLRIPDGLGDLKMRAVARAGNLSDAEERELPLLPARQRSLASKIVALDGNTEQKIDLGELPSDTKLESATLQIDPQLALSLLSSMPSLVQTPYDHLEQVLNRYVPLAILRKVFDRYPALANAASRLPKRAGRTEAWDAEDPRRLAKLAETPWVQEAVGKTELGSGERLIGLLDPAHVAKEAQIALAKLKAMQQSGGGFPWFPGGHADLYMTLYVLGHFGEAMRYGVAVPETIVADAVKFVVRELNTQKRSDVGSISLMLYGAYTVSSLGKIGSPLKDVVRAWVASCEPHSEAMTPMGKAYAAAVYRWLGDKPKAEAYLERAFEGAREDKLTGLYWAPEKISWLWYNDDVEKHAFLMKLLVDWKPKDPRIPEMAKWLLFNRKGSQWKSTKASVAAVFSLLEFMKSRGSLERNETFTWNWAGEKETRVAAPTDWLSKGWRWTKGPEAERRPYSTATVQKKGPGLAFASLTALFSTADPQQSEGGPLELERRVFERVAKGEGYELRSLDDGARVKVGTELEIQLLFKTTSELEYVQLKSPRGAGFEAETLVSGWMWDSVGRFEEPRDSLTNFFMPWVPRGEYVLRYRMRATTPGKFRFGGSVVQSIYAPEIAATTRGLNLEVER